MENNFLLLLGVVLLSFPPAPRPRGEMPPKKRTSSAKKPTTKKTKPKHNEENTEADASETCSVLSDASSVSAFDDNCSVDSQSRYNLRPRKQRTPTPMPTRRGRKSQSTAKTAKSKSIVGQELEPINEEREGSDKETPLAVNLLQAFQQVEAKHQGKELKEEELVRNDHKAKLTSDEDIKNWIKSVTKEELDADPLVQDSHKKDAISNDDRPTLEEPTTTCNESDKEPQINEDPLLDEDKGLQDSEDEKCHPIEDKDLSQTDEMDSTDDGNSKQEVDDNHSKQDSGDEQDVDENICEPVTEMGGDTNDESDDEPPDDFSTQQAKAQVIKRWKEEASVYTSRFMNLPC